MGTSIASTPFAWNPGASLSSDEAAHQQRGARQHHERHGDFGGDQDGSPAASASCSWIARLRERGLRAKRLGTGGQGEQNCAQDG
jgi:hypothetical protein